MVEKRKIEYKMITHQGKEVKAMRYKGDDTWQIVRDDNGG